MSGPIDDPPPGTGPAPVVRRATPADAAACLRVYAPYVRETTATFEDRVPTVDEFEARISRALEHHDWLVAELDGRVAGYAYAARVKDGGAYRWWWEVSVCGARAARGHGLGRSLYTSLFARLEEVGFRRLLAVVTLPNHPSVALHLSMGFREAGRLERIGFKHGRWLDVARLQAGLGPDPAAPPG